MDEPDAQTYLKQLAEVMVQREWTAHLQGRGAKVALRVANPAATELSESIVCRKYDRGWTFCWSWDQAIAAVDDVPAAADRIQHVLRGVDR